MHTTRRAILGAGAAGAALLAGCGRSQNASAAMLARLDQLSTDILRQAPERATSLGVTEERAGGRFIDRMSDVSKDAVRQDTAMLQSALSDLERIDRDRLNGQDITTYDVVTTSLRNQIEQQSFEIGTGALQPYIVTQLTGAYQDVPDFLDSQHPLTTRDQAEAYLARLSGFAGQLGQETAIIAEDASAGVIPPDFAIDRALEQMGAIIALAPTQTVLVQSLARRLPDIAEIPEAERVGFVSRAETIVRDEVFPAYLQQAAALRAVRPRAAHDAGVWRLPRGEELYATALRGRTTTAMTPAEIHNTGVELIAQFNAEMDTILRTQGMTRGTVAERMAALARRPDQLYPNTDAGRAQLLGDLNVQVRAIEALMPQVSGVLARAELEIKRVPPYIEAGAPGGYYNRAALDGSRAGQYYINLRDTAEWPRFSLPTLTYHEGVPGHHWQGSIQQEAGELPFIRSALLRFGAYSEGWGLYAEQLAGELGVYDDDPLGRLGYLQSMTFRASRLVVDTGIHSLRWSREQAVDSMIAATGDARSSVTTEIERYCVWPGQACSYMVGKMTILRLRDEARQAMGERFDLKGFHDTVLTNGSIPLSVLEASVRAWSSASA